MSWTQIFDIIFCALLIRFLLNWLLANRHVARFVLILFSLTVFVRDRSNKNCLIDGILPENFRKK